MKDKELIDLILRKAPIDTYGTGDHKFQNIMFYFINYIRKELDMPSCPMQEIMRDPHNYWEEAIQLMKENKEFLVMVTELPF